MAALVNPDEYLDYSPLTPRVGGVAARDFTQLTFAEALPFLTLCLPTFAQRMVYLRMTENLSQAETAKELCVSERTVRRWQEGIEASLEDCFNALDYTEWEVHNDEQ